jgi:hypothetical protein
MRIDDIPQKIYRDEELLYYESNSRKIDYVITTLTPLVKLLIQIGELATPNGESILGGLETDNDINTRVGTLTPNQIILHVSGLNHTLQRMVKSDVLANMNELIKEDVWVPFGETTDTRGILQFDDKKNKEFEAAVGIAMRAAQNIIDALQQPQMLPMQRSDLVEGEGIMDEPQPSQDMVQLDQESAKYIYRYDVTRSPPFVQARVGVKYMISMLGCLTPRGIVRDLIRGEDFVITGDDILSLNQRNVKQFEFRLTAASRDHPRVTFAFPNYVHTIPLNDQAEVQLHIYVPVSQQNVVIPMSYHSDYVDVQLPSLSILQLPPLNLINPTQMIELFASDLQNVYLHANLQLESCPMEQLVSARVNFAALTEPICSFLDILFTQTEAFSEELAGKHVKVPYIYTINMQNMTCIRTHIMKHDLSIPIITSDQFEKFNVMTTADGLNIEQHLIRYTLFQMMLTYRKFTFEDFRTCPEHHIMFDLYLRRGLSEVGYHYDLSPGTIVSSVGLLYSMPHDHVKVGPQLIPRRYRTDEVISDINVIPMSSFIVRNSAILFNNATFAHSTPSLEHFMSRMPQNVGYEVRNQKHESIHTATLNVTHDQFEFPESIRARLTESSVNPSRTFLRSWHIVSISKEQKANLGASQNVSFSNGMPFTRMAEMTFIECLNWIREKKCTCIEVGMDSVSGEIVTPSKLAGFLRGGRISAVQNTLNAGIKLSKTPSKTPSKTHSKTPSKTHSKTHSKTQYSPSHRSAPPIRASTISHLKQQISSKLKQLRAVLQNPEKNVVVVAGKPRRTRSHSHTKISRKSSASKYTRKVRSV